MLDLWLNSDYRYEPWNISGKINELANMFSCLRLPSTTTRIPRSVTKYKKFKVNELRVLLLFGNVIFKKSLAKKILQSLITACSDHASRRISENSFRRSENYLSFVM